MTTGKVTITLDDMSRRSAGEVEAAYDLWAEVYDSDRNTTRDLDATVLRKQQLNLVGADVLEIGCGTGKNTIWLAEQARSVLALDFSEGMLRKARERVREHAVKFVRADLRQPWPVAAASIDVVVADLVLEHVEHLEPFFEAAARVLRTGGRLFVSELHPFRQQLGAQARFIAPETGDQHLVPAYRHAWSEYLNAGIGAGLKLLHAGEWCDPEALAEAPPRLLALLWGRG